jgi:tetratricopeptide (TPR) repeat protein
VAGIFQFIQNALSTFLHEGNASMVEEALTTLAAICLGDDLNALQGAVQLRDYVDRASLRFPVHETMHKKTHYLTLLFNVVEQEQASLWQNAMEQSFFDKIALAELELRRGLETQHQQQYEESQEHYTRALDGLQSLENSTGLLDSLWCQLYQGRASVRLKLCQWDGALEDTHAILELNEEVTEAHVLKAKILEDMGKVVEAKKALAKAIVANPHDEALLSQLERLNVD